MYFRVKLHNRIPNKLVCHLPQNNKISKQQVSKFIHLSEQDHLLDKKSMLNEYM